MMKKEYRIKKNSEIDAIFKKRNIRSDSYFAVYQSKDLMSGHFRFALSIGKKYGNAVQRNIAKRRIRMIISSYKNFYPHDALFVIVIKPKSITLNYQEMHEKLTILLKKSNLMEKTDE